MSYFLNQRLMRFLASLRGAASLGGFAAVLVLLVSGLSADSQEATKSGGFLYSDYLTTRDDASLAAGEPFAKAGSFDVQLRQTALADGRDKVLAAAVEELQSIPLREWTLGYLFNDTDASDIAAAGRLHTTKSGWRLLEATAQAAVSAASADAQESGIIRHIGLDLRSRLGGRFGSAGLNVLGALHESEKNALAWQLRGYAGHDEIHGGNLGWIYRHAAGEQLTGFNMFTDYEDRDGETFLRWSAGGEFRSAWADVFVNYYKAFSDPIIHDNIATYTADGYDGAVHLHAPRHRWLTAIAEYYFYKGKYTQRDEDGLRAGLRFSPERFPVVMEFKYDNGLGSPWGGRFEFLHKFGEQHNGNGAVAIARPQDWFFAPAEREHTQRIYTVQIAPATASWRLRGVSPEGGAVEINARNTDLTATALAFGFGVLGTQNNIEIDVPTTTVYALPPSSVAITAITGLPVSGGEVSAVFAYKDDKTTVRIGSTVVFAAGGERGFSLLDGKAIVETETPVTAAVLSVFSGGRFATVMMVSVLSSSTVSLSYDGNAVDIETGGGGFAAVLAALRITVMVSPAADFVSVRYDLAAGVLTISTSGTNVSLISPFGRFSCEDLSPTLVAVIACPTLFKAEMRENTAYNTTMTFAGEASAATLSQVNITESENGAGVGTFADISHVERALPNTEMPFAFLTVSGTPAGYNFDFSIVGGDTDAVSVGVDTSELFLEVGVGDGQAIFTVRAVENGDSGAILTAALTLSLAETMLADVSASLENLLGRTIEPTFTFAGLENTQSTLAIIAPSGGIGQYAYTAQGGEELLRVHSSGGIVLINSPLLGDLNTTEFRITVRVSDVNAADASSTIDFAVGTGDYFLTITARMTGFGEELQAAVNSPPPLPGLFRGVPGDLQSYRLPTVVAFTVQAIGGIPPHTYTVTGVECIALNTLEVPICPSELSEAFSVNATTGVVEWSAVGIPAAGSSSGAAVYTPTVQVIDLQGNEFEIGVSVTVYRPLRSALVERDDRTQQISVNVLNQYEWNPVLEDPSATLATNVTVVALTVISDAEGVVVTPDLDAGGRLVWNNTDQVLEFNALSLADDAKLFTATLAVSDTGVGADLTEDDVSLILTVLVRPISPLRLRDTEVLHILYESDPDDDAARLLPVSDSVFRIEATGGGSEITRGYTISEQNCTVIVGTAANNCGHSLSIFLLSSNITVTMVGLSVTINGVLVPEMDDSGNPLSVLATVTGNVVLWADDPIANVEEAQYSLEVQVLDKDAGGATVEIYLTTITIRAYSIQRLQALVTGPGGDGSANTPLMLTIDAAALAGSSDMPFATVALSGGVGGGTLSWSCDASALTKNLTNNISGINVLPAGCGGQDSDEIVLSYPNFGADLLAGDNMFVFTITDQRRSVFARDIPVFMPANVNTCTAAQIAAGDSTCESQPLDVAVDLLLTVHLEVRAQGFAQFSATDVVNTRAALGDSAAVMYEDPNFVFLASDVRLLTYNEVADLAGLVIGGAVHNNAVAVAPANLVLLTVTPSNLLTIGTADGRCDYANGACADSLRFRTASELAAETIPALMTLVISLSGRAADSRVLDFVPLDGVLTIVLGQREVVANMDASVGGDGTERNPFMLTIDSTALQMILGTVSAVSGGGAVSLVSVDNFDRGEATRLADDIPRPVSINSGNVLVFSGDLADPLRTVVFAATGTISVNYATNGLYAAAFRVIGQNARDELLSTPPAGLLYFRTQDISECASDLRYYSASGFIVADDGIVSAGDSQVRQISGAFTTLHAVRHDNLLWWSSQVVDAGSGAPIGPCERSVNPDDDAALMASLQNGEFLVRPDFQVSLAGPQILLGATGFTIQTALDGSGTSAAPLLITLDSLYRPPFAVLASISPIGGGNTFYSTEADWTVENKATCPCEFGFTSVNSSWAPGLKIVRVEGQSLQHAHYVYVSLVAPTANRPDSIEVASPSGGGITGSGTAADPLVIPFLQGGNLARAVVTLSVASPQADALYRFASGSNFAIANRDIVISAATSTTPAETTRGGFLRFADGAAITAGLTQVSVSLFLVNAEGFDLPGTELMTIVHLNLVEYTADDLQVFFFPHPRLTSEGVDGRLSVFGAPTDMALAGSVDHPFVLSGSDFESFDDAAIQALLSISVQVAGLPSGFSGFVSSGGGVVDVVSSRSGFNSVGNARLNFAVADSAGVDSRPSPFPPNIIPQEPFYGEVVAPYASRNIFNAANVFLPVCLRGEIETRNGAVGTARRLHIIYTPALADVVANSCVSAGELQMTFQPSRIGGNAPPTRLSVFGNPTDPTLNGSRENPFLYKSNTASFGFLGGRVVEAVVQRVSSLSVTTAIYDFQNVTSEANGPTITQQNFPQVALGAISSYTSTRSTIHPPFFNIQHVSGINTGTFNGTGPCLRLPVTLSNPDFADLGQVSRSLFLIPISQGTDFANATNACSGVESRGLSSSFDGSGAADDPLVFTTTGRTTTTDPAGVETTIGMTIAAGEVLATIDIIGDTISLTISLAADSSPLLALNTVTRELSFAAEVVANNDFYAATVLAHADGIDLTIAANVSMRASGCRAVYHEADYIMFGTNLRELFGSPLFVRLGNGQNPELLVISGNTDTIQYPQNRRGRGFRAGDIIYKREGPSVLQASSAERAASRFEERWTVFDIDDSDIGAGTRQYLARRVVENNQYLDVCDRPLQTPLQTGEFVVPPRFTFLAAESTPLYSGLRAISLPDTIVVPTPSAISGATVIASVDFQGGVYPALSVVIHGCRDISGAHCANINSRLTLHPGGNIIVTQAIDYSAGEVELTLIGREGAGPLFSETVRVQLGAPAETACLALPEAQKPLVFPALQGDVLFSDSGFARSSARFPHLSNFISDLAAVWRRDPATGLYEYSTANAFSGGATINIGDFIAIAQQQGTQLNTALDELTPPLRDHRSIAALTRGDSGFFVYQQRNGFPGVALIEDPGGYAHVAPLLPRRSCTFNAFGEFMINASDHTVIRNPADYANAITTIAPPALVLSPAPILALATHSYPVDSTDTIPVLQIPIADAVGGFLTVDISRGDGAVTLSGDCANRATCVVFIDSSGSFVNGYEVSQAGNQIVVAASTGFTPATGVVRAVQIRVSDSAGNETNLTTRFEFIPPPPPLALGAPESGNSGNSAGNRINVPNAAANNGARITLNITGGVAPYSDNTNYGNGDHESDNDGILLTVEISGSQLIIVFSGFSTNDTWSPAIFGVRDAAGATTRRDVHIGVVAPAPLALAAPSNQHSSAVPTGGGNSQLSIPYNSQTANTALGNSATVNIFTVNISSGSPPYSLSGSCATTGRPTCVVDQNGDVATGYTVVLSGNQVLIGVRTNVLPATLFLNTIKIRVSDSASAVGNFAMGFVLSTPNALAFGAALQVAGILLGTNDGDSSGNPVEIDRQNSSTVVLPIRGGFGNFTLTSNATVQSTNGNNANISIVGNEVRIQVGPTTSGDTWSPVNIKVQDSSGTEITRDVYIELINV